MADKHQNTPPAPAPFDAEAAIKLLQDQIEIQNTIIESMSASIEALNKKIDGVASEVVSSVSIGQVAAKVKPKDPGIIKVGDKAYKFKLLKFRLQLDDTGPLVTLTAEEAARDQEVLQKCVALGLLIPA